jgi:hypothetical protein
MGAEKGKKKPIPKDGREQAKVTGHRYPKKSAQAQTLKKQNTNESERKDENTHHKAKPVCITMKPNTQMRRQTEGNTGEK